MPVGTKKVRHERQTTMSTVSHPTGEHPNNESERMARRWEANAAGLFYQEPSPLNVMLVKMRFEFDLAQSEKAKGRTADRDVIRKALDSAHAAAKDCAPYFHRRLSSLNDTPTPWNLSVLSDEELEVLENIINKASGDPNQVQGASVTTLTDGSQGYQ
jgi:hypothetical protein